MKTIHFSNLQTHLKLHPKFHPKYKKKIFIVKNKKKIINKPENRKSLIIIYIYKNKRLQNKLKLVKNYNQLINLKTCNSSLKHLKMKTKEIK